MGGGLPYRRPEKPSPSGRGLGEGESQCAAQPPAKRTPPRRHSRPGRNPEPRLPPEQRKAGRVDSRFRGNDGGVGGFHMALDGVQRFSLTQPSPAGRGLLRACANARTSAAVIPAPSSVIPAHHPPFPPPTVIPAPRRHSRESGNPRPRPCAAPGIPPGFWIPASAGMTVEAAGGMMVESRALAQANEKPPFRKRGVGGIAPPHQPRKAGRKGRLVGGLSPHDPSESPNPPFAKGGLCLAAGQPTPSFRAYPGIRIPEAFRRGGGPGCGFPLSRE